MEKEKKKKKSPLPFSLAPYPKIVQDQERLVNLTASLQVITIPFQSPPPFLLSELGEGVCVAG